MSLENSMYRPCIPLLIVALGLPAHAENFYAPTTPLTLGAALDLAVRANPRLASARHERDAVDGAVAQAGMRPNPVLGIGVEDTRRATRETTVQLSQPLELGGKRQARVDVAERTLETAGADLRAREADVRAGVTQAFYDVLSAQERAQLAHDALDVAARFTTTVARRVQAGKVSPVDATRARVAEANVRLDALKIDGELATARQALAGFWGSPMPTFNDVVGDLATLPPLPDWTSLAARVAQAPLVARARSDVAQRQAQLRLEQSRRSPDLTVTVGMKRSNELGVNQAVFGVAIPLPLFDRNQGNVLDALRRTDTAGADLQAAQTDTHQALAQAYQALGVARQAAQTLATEIVPGAQSAYDAAVKGFEFGKFAYVDVLDAQRTLIQAKAQTIQALVDAHRAAIQIDRLVGATAPRIQP
jgi:cobalt-zinc-cadmium efflux system outer membrane protein